MLDGRNIDDYIYNWAISFPIDKWWRKKHNVPFGSKRHRDISFIDQLVEFREDQIFSKLVSGNVKPYEGGRGDWIEKREVSQEDIDKMFDKIDISKIREA